MEKYQAYNDDSLIGLLKVGDERALTELYNRYWDKMLVVSLNRLKDLDVAQEIVQDVFTRLWQRRLEIEIKYSVSAYLSAAIKYGVIDYMSTKHYRNQASELSEQYQLTYEPSCEEQLFEKELMRKIEESISELPERCQLVFKLSRESGMTYKQIAQKLNISEKTVEAHMSKALKSIRTNLNVVAFSILLLYTQK